MSMRWVTERVRVRAERLEHHLLGLLPTAHTEQHRSVRNPAMRVENTRPAAESVEDQLVDEPVPFLGAAQIAAAIAG